MAMNNTRHGKEALLSEIRALAFAKVETALFLDTHPDSRGAVAFYRDTADKLEKLTEEYVDRFGPLTHSDVRGDDWTWVNGPWPWQREGDENTKGDM